MAKDINRASGRAQDMSDDELIRAYKSTGDTVTKAVYKRELQNRGY